MTMGDVAAAVGGNVERIRHIRNMTGKDLSGKLADLGVSMSVATVSEIERSKRKVSVNELLVLAVALNTSIIDLLMPPDGDTLSVAVGNELGVDDLYWWLRGDQPWPSDASMDEFVKAARGHHQRMLWSNSDPVVKSILLLEGAVRLAQSGQPWRIFAGTLVPGLQKALEGVNQSVGELIERIEADDASRSR